MAFLSFFTPDQARLAGLGVWQLVLTDWGDLTPAAPDNDVISYGRWPDGIPGLIPTGNANQQILPPGVSITMAPNSTVDIVQSYVFPPFFPGVPNVNPNSNLLAFLNMNNISTDRPFFGQFESASWLHCHPSRVYENNYFALDTNTSTPFKPKLMTPELRLQFFLRTPASGVPKRAPLIDTGEAASIAPFGLQDFRIWPVAGRKHIRVTVAPNKSFPTAISARLTGIDRVGFTGLGAYLKEYPLAGPTAIGANGQAVFYLNNQEITWLVLKADTLGVGTSVEWNMEALD